LRFNLEVLFLVEEVFVDAEIGVVLEGGRENHEALTASTNQQLTQYPNSIS
jgi:hypothetical protein